MLDRVGIEKTLYAQCLEQKHHSPQFIMARRKGRKLNSPNSPLDPRKSRGGNIKDGMGVVKGTNVKGGAFTFDPSKHKRDPLTGKWATKPDVVKPQKDRKKATKPTSSEAKKPKPSSPFAKFRQRVRDALKQQLINYAKNKSDKSKSTPSKPDSVSTLMSSLTQKGLDPKPEPAEPKTTTPKQVSKEYTDTINSAKSKISQFKLDSPVKVFETLKAQINAEIKSLDPKNPEDVEKAQKLLSKKSKLKQSLDIYLEKQMNLLYQELLDNNNSVNSDLLVGQTNFQIGEYTKNLKPANTEDPIYKTHTPVISKALAEFHKLTGGILNNLVPRIGLSETKRSWAGVDAQEPQKGNYLSISVTRSNDVKPSVFHEAAHLLEGSDPKFANLAKEFLAKNRTSDELKQIKGYPAGEVAYPGNWVHPYVGKIYENSPSTEVISMGIERFASPRVMVEFYLKDKEHFALTLGIIESLKVPEHLKPTPLRREETPPLQGEKLLSPLDTKLQGWNFFKKEGKKPETLKTPPLRVDLSKASKEFNTVDNLAESKVKEYDLDSVPPFIRERYQGLKAELAKLKPEQEEESRKIHAEMDSLHKVSNDILESKMQALTNELLGNNVDTDSILKGVKIKSKDYDSEEDISEKYPEDIEIAKKYLADFHRMTNGKMANLIPEVEVVSDGRSWAYDDKNSPETENFLSLAIGGGLSDNIARGDTFHESAHLLEMAYPEVNRLAQEFLTMTRDSDKLYRLSDLMPDRGYDDDELAYTDKWVAPYVGKVYEDSPSTEVISVGFEYFASPQSMAKLYVQDKEHFKLILGVLQYISRLKRPTT